MTRGQEEAWMLKSHAFFPRGAGRRASVSGNHRFTMSHGEGWQYIQLGRYVERTDTLASSDGHAFQAHGAAGGPGGGKRGISGVGGLLRACVAFEAYCKVYTAEMRPLRVAEFLLLNPEFPTFGAIFGGSRERSAAHYRGID